MNRTDVLVIGAGLAGSIAALKASQLGKKVILIRGDTKSASTWAQGGIVKPTSEDSQNLRTDILEAGCGTNNPNAVNSIVEEGEALIKTWLIDKAKVQFDDDLALEAAHSKARILHVKDHTGRDIMKQLNELVEKDPNISVVNGLLIDFMQTDRHDKRVQSIYKTSRCCGAYIFNQSTRKVEAQIARAVVLATGGFSALYEHATGPRSLTGTGIAAAHRAGARTMHLEYVQFHPTALYIANDRRVLLSEALRGAGAKLLNSKKEPYVDELAPRDVVARSTHKELLENNATHVWLDCRKIENFQEHFPSLFEILVENKLNPSEDLIPVVPAAHYTLGGVWTNMAGQTSLKGLMAAGEVACTGLHGANRLASTSLLEALVYGDKAGESAANYASQNHELDFEAQEWIHGEENVDPALLQQDWQLLRKTMWNYVGLSRNKARLKRAERILSDLRNDVEDFYSHGQLNESLIGLRQAALVSTLVLYAALRNDTSLGTHFRED